MIDSLDVFQKHYQTYCERLKTIDFDAIKDNIGLVSGENGFMLPFFNRRYSVSSMGIIDALS